jgi:hypothetical protein
MRRIPLTIAAFFTGLLACAAIASAAPQGKYTICHVQRGHPGNVQTIDVSIAAVPAHLAHGDTPGPCETLTGICESDQDKLLLVFNAGASTLSVNPNDRSSVIVTIADADSQSVVFGDRPSRLVAVIDTQTVIDFLADVATNDPANLAIVGHLPEGTVEILVIETLDANIEPNSGYVSLEGRLLGDFDAPESQLRLD